MLAGHVERQPALSYQWLRNGAADPRRDRQANTRLQSPNRADKGKAVQCQVTATNAGGSSVAVSRDAVVLRPNRSNERPAVPAVEHRGAERDRVGGQHADVQPAKRCGRAARRRIRLPVAAGRRADRRRGSDESTR